VSLSNGALLRRDGGRREEVGGYRFLAKFTLPSNNFVSHSPGSIGGHMVVLRRIRRVNETGDVPIEFTCPRGTHDLNLVTGSLQLYTDRL